jgi:hypothetical protein
MMTVDELRMNNAIVRELFSRSRPTGGIVKPAFTGGRGHSCRLGPPVSDRSESAGVRVR